MLRVALTGGIASGKTAVSDAFAKLGVPIIDADVASRAVVEPGSEGLQQLVKRFGEDILTADGTLDRRALRGIIFNDNQARTDTNAILHPLIRQWMQQTSAQQPAPYQIFVIPLLAETNQAEQYDRILLVRCSESTRIARLMQRDGITELDARQILAAQSSDEERQRIANDFIVNEGDYDELTANVLQLHHLYLNLAQNASGA
ncbi:dephospho-CoA kinase [Permianibacter aggregans]|uniref:Dephospho-CoA kinase n=1 Tax=Permianibacter aggregans TaxID=1510150 RepID=A0A4R6UN55_9GAMM|nr:dephospho-CoA kinase [Permianibacter aggregans]QGX39018.1 dephospho-CoA kinase [Permianibacter aggregans]TDQ44644.1 dephospho-CoA kinase [Permianibacter aggregans]